MAQSKDNRTWKRSRERKTENGWPMKWVQKIPKGMISQGSTTCASDGSTEIQLLQTFNPVASRTVGHDTNMLTDIFILPSLDEPFLSSSSSGLFLQLFLMRRTATSEPWCKFFACRRSKSRLEKGLRQMPQMYGLSLLWVSKMCLVRCSSRVNALWQCLQLNIRRFPVAVLVP